MSLVFEAMDAPEAKRVNAVRETDILDDDVKDFAERNNNNNNQTKQNGEGDKKKSEDKGPRRPYKDKDTQCGLWSWRPRCLRPFGTIWSFTAALSIMTIISSMNFTYYSAVITQIERRFGLSSAMTGFIKNIDNIGFMLTVLAVSHLGRYGNKPRILAVASVLSALSIFLFAVPHFIYGGPVDSASAAVGGGGPAGTDLLSTGLNVTAPTNPRGRYETCDGVDESAFDPTGCSSRNTLLAFSGGALTLFILSELFQGMSMSPKSTLSMTYMDDNARDRSPQHFGIMFGMRAFAPMLGFLMGAWTNSLYVDLSDPGIDQRDPRWIGAWWLGFVICALCTLVWALPIAMFPRRLADAPEETEAMKKGSENANENILGKLKDVPLSCWRLVSNPVFMCTILASCFNISLIGFSTFMPKYLQSYFGKTAAWASIYTGLISSLSWGLGPMIGGPIIARMKMTVPKALRFVVIVQIVSVIGYIVALCLRCPHERWAGDFNLDEGVSPAMPCNSNCSCDPTAFTPVCGSDGITYFSPCYAGCQLESLVTNSTKKEFFNCQCIDDGAGHVTLGQCPSQCKTFEVYVVVLFFTFLVTSVIVVPLMTTMMRCVDEKDKAMSLAFGSFVMQFAAFPAPILYGRVIDSVCLVQQSSCVRKGACLLYDHDAFRIRLHVLPVGAKVSAVLLFLVAWYYSRKAERRQLAEARVTDCIVSVDVKAVDDDKKDRETFI